MKRSKASQAIRDFYIFSPSNPGPATAILKKLYGAFTRIHRTAFRKLIREIEAEVRREEQK